MTDHEAATGGAAFKDRKIGLVVFGIFQILLGVLCSLLLPLMILGSLLDKNASSGTSLSMLIPGMLVYAFLAGWFITMGVGSILARRWARALSLIFSWLWLVCGIGGLLFLLVFMPGMLAKMSQGGQMPPSAVAIVKLVMFGTLAVIYVILPGMFVFFYRSRHVKATCDARDARTRWTDRCPLPVLALSLMFGFWAGSMSFMGFYNWAIPFFGCILSGPAGAAVAVVLVLVTGYLSWGTWHLSLTAWWCAVLSMILWTVSTILTFARVDFMQLYEKMNFPAQQIELMKQSGMPHNPAMIWFFSAWFAGFLAYLFYTKRFFNRG
jgi:hypothetical protein